MRIVSTIDRRRLVMAKGRPRCGCNRSGRVLVLNDAVVLCQLLGRDSRERGGDPRVCPPT